MPKLNQNQLAKLAKTVARQLPLTETDGLLAILNEFQPSPEVLAAVICGVLAERERSAVAAKGGA